jgi:hypothetical protein
MAGRRCYFLAMLESMTGTIARFVEQFESRFQPLSEECAISSRGELHEIR